MVTDEAIINDQGELIENDNFESPTLVRSQNPYDICMRCFRKDQFPEADTDFFTDMSLSKEHWDQLESLEPSVVNAQSSLTSEQKSTLIMSVIGDSKV